MHSIQLSLAPAHVHLRFRCLNLCCISGVGRSCCGQRTANILFFFTALIELNSLTFWANRSLENPPPPPRVHAKGFSRALGYYFPQFAEFYRALLPHTRWCLPRRKTMKTKYQVPVCILSGCEPLSYRRPGRYAIPS